jgi:hypothetical protein
MSAFVQHTDHIDLLVTALVRYDVRPGIKDVTAPGHWRTINLLDLDEVGRTLLRENVKSVMDRYDSIDGEEQADYAAQIASYNYFSTPDPQPSVVALIKACIGYGYQSCEHAGWETSEAKAIVDALESALIRKLPGMQEANTWSYVRPEMTHRKPVALNHLT